LGTHPLHAALSRSAHYPIVEYFVQQDPDALLVRSEAGMLPVQVALSRRNMDAARLLLQQRPASVDDPDATGANLFHFLLDFLHQDADDAAPLELLECVTLLIEHGPHAAHVPDGRGRLPLQYATAHGAPLDVVYDLLRHQPMTVVPSSSSSSPSEEGTVTAPAGRTLPCRKRTRTL
jgi:ankyrin repeat protein